VIDFPVGPDDLLEFPYMQISVKVRVREALAILTHNTESLRAHIQKRYKDPRYKYMNQKEYKSIRYWLTPANWTGFKAGFILDYLMCECLTRQAKHSCFEFPIEFTQESGLRDVLKVDPALIEIFSAGGIVEKFVAKLMMAIKPRPHYWQIIKEKLNNNVDEYITYMLNQKRREMELVQSAATEGQQRTFLQDEARAEVNRQKLERMQQARILAADQLYRVPDPITIRVDDHNGDNGVRITGAGGGDIAAAPGILAIEDYGPTITGTSTVGTARDVADTIQPQPLDTERLMQAIRELDEQVRALATRQAEDDTHPGA
jgi:hypothetical protein